jgi:hypothetical protein
MGVRTDAPISTSWLSSVVAEMHLGDTEGCLECVHVPQIKLSIRIPHEGYTYPLNTKRPIRRTFNRPMWYLEW